MEWMFMPFKRYADFSGRSRRMEYWMWVLLQVIVYIVFWVLMMALGGGALMMGGTDPTAMAAAGGGIMIISVIYMIYGLVALIPGIAVAVRRLHDTNRSGWWLLGPIGCYIVGFATMFGGIASAASGGQGGGALAIVGMIAILGAIVFGLVLLVFMFLEGTKGPNKYGPDPKGQDTGQVFA